MYSGQIAKVVVAVCLIGGAKLAAMRFEPSPVLRVDPQKKLGALPLEIAGWKGEDSPEDKHIMKRVGGLDMITRVYTDPGGHQAIVHVSSYRGVEFGVPHPPQVCYGDAGWERVKEATVSANSFKFAAFDFRKDADRVFVYNWYQMGSQTADGYNTLRKVFQSFRAATHRPFLVKVMIQADAEGELAGPQPCFALTSAIRDWVEQYR